MTNRPSINDDYAQWLMGVFEQVKEDGFPEFWESLKVRDHNGKCYLIDVTIQEAASTAAVIN